MQRKGIAAFSALLVSLALVACGDGGEETTASTSVAEGAQGSQAREQVQGRAREIEEERRTQPEGRTRPKGAEQQDEGDGSSQTPAPPVAHSDSGGGAAQFHRKGSDNSIQEFGQEGGGAEMAAAASVLHAYLDARAAGRWEDACSYLAAEVIAAMEQFASAGGQEQPQGCPQILEALSSGAGAAGLREAAKVDVGSLRLEGDRGFLLYHGPQGFDFAIPVALEGGEWKLSAPDATPLP